MVKFICDGCGQEETGIYRGSCWLKPRAWYIKKYKELPLIACCENCVKIIAVKFNTTDVILPF